MMKLTTEMRDYRKDFIPEEMTVEFPRSYSTQHMCDWERHEILERIYFGGLGVRFFQANKKPREKIGGIWRSEYCFDRELQFVQLTINPNCGFYVGQAGPYDYEDHASLFIDVPMEVSVHMDLSSTHWFKVEECWSLDNMVRLLRDLGCGQLRWSNLHVAEICLKLANFLEYNRDDYYWSLEALVKGLTDFKKKFKEEEEEGVKS